MRLWPFSIRTNKALRPGYLDVCPDTSKTLEDILFPIFLEMLPADDEKDSLPPFDKVGFLLMP